MRLRGFATHVAVVVALMAMAAVPPAGAIPPLTEGQSHGALVFEADVRFNPPGRAWYGQGVLALSTGTTNAVCTGYSSNADFQTEVSTLSLNCWGAANIGGERLSLSCQLALFRIATEGEMDGTCVATRGAESYTLLAAGAFQAATTNAYIIDYTAAGALVLTTATR
jgi:hypothetical protein